MIAARSIGPVRATFLVAGNMIGSGIYLLPATLAAAGSISIIGWIISGLGAFLLAFVFALLFRLRPESAGLVRQVAEGAGRFLGFQTSLFYWFGCWLGNVAIALATTGYLTIFFPALRDSGAAALTTIGVTWLLTALNFLGARRVTEFEGLSLVIGLVPVLAVAVFGWLVFDPEMFLRSWNVSGASDFSAISASLLPIFFAFLGLECAAVAARVVRDPARDVPIATLGGVGLAAIVYVAASAALMGMMPAAALAASDAPFADAVGRWIGPAAGLLVAVCAVVKTMGTLSGWILVTAEAAKSGADTGVFPAFFKEKGEGPPKRNLIIVALLMTGVILASSAPRLADQFNLLASLSTIFFLLIFVYCCLALWRLSGSASARMRWGARTVAVLAAFYCLWAIAASAQNLIVLSIAGFALTVPLFFLMRRGLAHAT